MRGVIFLGAVFFGVAAGIFSGCGAGKPSQPVSTIAVSILPLKYLTDSIGGGDFATVVIVPPGASPETFEPTLSSMKEVSRAKAYFQVGLLDFERSFETAVRNNGSEIRFVDLSQGLALIAGEDSSSQTDDTEAIGGHHHGTDPHVWLSPARFRQMAENVARTVTEINPDSVEKYAVNLHQVISTIDFVDRYILSSFNELKGRSFLIYHPFLTYYAVDYDLRQIPIEQEGKEPSVAYLKTTMSRIGEERLNTVFYQQEQHRRVVESLIEQAGLQAVALDPLAYDWPENMKHLTDLLKESLYE
jgi:zinc transport system substrate-binding protein